MGVLSVGLNILTLLIICWLLYLIQLTYNMREDRTLNPLDVFKRMLHDRTNISVTRARTIPKTGNIGDFVGYEYEDDDIVDYPFT